MSLIAPMLVSVVVDRRFLVACSIVAINLVENLRLVLRCIDDARVVLDIACSQDSSTSILKIRLIIDLWQLKILFVCVVTLSFILHSILIVLCILVSCVSSWVSRARLLIPFLDGCESSQTILVRWFSTLQIFS